MRMCVNPSNPMLFDFCWVWFIGEDSGCPEQCCLTFREFGLDWFWKGFIFFLGSGRMFLEHIIQRQSKRVKHETKHVFIHTAFQTFLFS
ncbi:hypothetical protein MANES_03G125450v8 [Manihot esculenta]|uniref:Uncharacterized protein n=2 Tax=Manihot esculenta TaxID=3983 RepID=A0ACB7HZT4_MANES|nr:hypothetical protein MANES_03G125450v8 [Manihot esculenta]KAG8658163.1 hypothetical protein MANES_03G125450v8 [Manihot esculenta]